MDILWKSILGGIITAILAVASKKGNILPGIIPLFPTFAIIALYIVGMKQNSLAFQETCTAGIKTIPAYFAFLIVCYFLIEKIDFRITLLLGLLFWLLATGIVFFGLKHLPYFSRS